MSTPPLDKIAEIAAMEDKMPSARTLQVERPHASGCSAGFGIRPKVDYVRNVLFTAGGCVQHEMAHSESARKYLLYFEPGGNEILRLPAAPQRPHPLLTSCGGTVPPPHRSTFDEHPKMSMHAGLRAQMPRSPPPKSTFCTVRVRPNRHARRHL